MFLYTMLTVLRLKICGLELKESHPHFSRDCPEYKPYTFFAWLQPLVAWIGLLGCILVFAFTSATWWDTKANFTKVAVAYAAVSGEQHLVLRPSKLTLL
jgi:amino acid transporter